MMLKRAFKYVDGGDGTAMGNPAPKESKRFRRWVGFISLFFVDF